MKKILFICTIHALTACRSAESSKIESTAKTTESSPTAICGVDKVAYEKMSFDLRDLIERGDKESLTNVVYSFSLSTVSPLDSKLAAKLKKESEAEQINGIAGSIGTGRGSLCAIVKLASSKHVKVIEGAKKFK